MNPPLKMILSVGATLVLVILSNSMFIVNQTQHALVIEFGKAVRTISKPGLRLKAPFLQDVIYFDKRITATDVEKSAVTASDRKRLVVDAYVMYRITDPLKFYQTLNENETRFRLKSIVESSLRQVIGNEPLSAVISAERANIMKKVTAIVNAQTSSGIKQQVISKENPAATTEASSQSNTPPLETATAEVPAVEVPAGGFGIEVVDVRIVRADLPADNSKSIYLRMQTERQREAKEFRATGDEEAQIIRAKADRTKTELLADAHKKSETIRGEGDAAAAKIYASAYSKDASFYNFYRSMQAYRASLNKENTTIMMSPNSEFLKFMDKNSGQ